MKQIFIASAACFFMLSSAHGQTNNTSAPPNLAYATPTLNLDVNTVISGKFVSGEDAWWGGYQLASLPLTSPKFALALGLPPNAAWPASASLPGKPFWSGYSGEYEAYPNYDTIVGLTSAGVTSPIGLGSGSVDLTASLMPLGVTTTLPSNLAGRQYMSGGFNTYPFSQLYGYFEITARIPSGQAEFPAFWLVPENMNTGVDTEIDIMEAQGSNTGVYWTTLHSRDYAKSGGTSGASGATITAGTDLSKGYHRYGVDWEASRITFYLDGAAVFSKATPSDMHVPMYIIVNLALGGWLGAPSNATPTQATFSISSLRAWQLPAQ